jgi:hypothetical protein
MKWWHDDIVVAVDHRWLHSTSLFEHFHMLWIGIWVHPYTVIPVMVGAIFWEFGVWWISRNWCCGVMVEAVNPRWLHPTTILDVCSVWAPPYTVDRHISASLHCYTCEGRGKILENWGKAEPKWRCDVMAEAVNPHWLHHTSILNAYKVSEHLHSMLLWMGTWVHPYTVILVEVGAKFWNIGVRWSPNDDVVSWLRL